MGAPEGHPFFGNQHTNGGGINKEVILTMLNQLSKKQLTL